MGNLKAYRINDCDTYAGHDLEEAIRAAIDLTGIPREEIYDPAIACEADPAERVRLDEDPTAYSTIGELVAQMNKPGLVCSTEY